MVGAERTRNSVCGAGGTAPTHEGGGCPVRKAINSTTPAAKVRSVSSRPGCDAQVGLPYQVERHLAVSENLGRAYATEMQLPGADTCKRYK